MSIGNLSLRGLAARLGIVAAAALGILGSTQVHAQQDKEFRIGWQKGASIALVKALGYLDERLTREGVKVRWIEFTAGPQMLEGLNVGSIDFASVGETPPVFAQAAGANLVYVGNEPAAPRAEKLLVPKNSPIKSVKELKGKRIALNKGSNVHYLLVKLLEREGLKYSDVKVAFLPPADARAAFESGSVDAWVIWDPFGAAAEAQIGARILADGTGVVNNYIFYLAARPFAEKHPEVLVSAIEEVNRSGAWTVANYDEAARILAPQIGLTPEIARVAVERYAYGLKPLTADVIRQQQEIADVFFELKLIPKKLDVASVVWQPKKLDVAATAGQKKN
ncbi:sulfonate ABC transporter substrate-binding protein [Pseudothauera rhizosphaerae]|uniref:Putative aliphatic sulfonates-binding protein n=1 Tax=Pseudothauera rhizosphaerae TaxID=2565932 RepID=A0A4S4B0Y7_9RHOO|nr:sulfonate ABC transporter substrate-binding protein [Pseudothauera rhizosphaerae]THF65304.1 sulfonate ABC transporter substrate-binding protein [Pseudothauera rhizosphaerae]